MGKIWQDEYVQLLIETIRNYEHIWNTKHPRYTLNKRTRHDSWKEISNLFNERCVDFQLKPVEICSKWNNLRLGFQKESKRIANLGLKCSRWKYYDMLSFLKDHPIKKQDSVLPTSKKHFLRQKPRLKQETVDETDAVSIGSVSPVNFQAKCDQKSVTSSCLGVSSSIAGNMRQSMDRTFGDYVSAEIKHLEQDLQIKAKKLIFDVLIDMQYEQEGRCRSSQV